MARAATPSRPRVVGGHFDEYQRLGDATIGVLREFTPSIERISIDEAFAVVAACTHLFGSPAEIARAVRSRVRAELGLPMSIGVARTKTWRKSHRRSRSRMDWSSSIQKLNPSFFTSCPSP
jgi:nucleotidyltransferase/DNA polymerase involved in DNA repair